METRKFKQLYEKSERILRNAVLVKIKLENALEIKTEEVSLFPNIKIECFDKSGENFMNVNDSGTRKLSSLKGNKFTYVSHYM